MAATPTMRQHTVRSTDDLILVRGDEDRRASVADVSAAVVAGAHTHTHTGVTDFDAQVRTSRLDQLAAPTADVGLNSHKLTGVVDPSGAQDAATKHYVDTALRAGSIQVAQVALGAVDTPGGVLSWPNPAGVAIVVRGVLLMATTPPTDPAVTADLAAGAVAIRTMPAADLQGATRRAPAVVNSGGPFGLLAGETLTLTTTPASGSVAGLVGNAAIEWFPAG